MSASARPLLAFRRLSLQSRADLSVEIAKGTSFVDLVTMAVEKMTPEQLADYCLAFEHLRPKQAYLPGDPILRSMLTLEVERVDSGCLLTPGILYARYVYRCQECGRYPLPIAWFGRGTRPLMKEIHGADLIATHYGRGYRNCLLRAIKAKQAAGKAAKNGETENHG